MRPSTTFNEQQDLSARGGIKHQVSSNKIINNPMASYLALLCSHFASDAAYWSKLPPAPYRSYSLPALLIGLCRNRPQSGQAKISSYASANTQTHRLSPPAQLLPLPACIK